MTIQLNIFSTVFDKEAIVYISDILDQNHPASSGEFGIDSDDRKSEILRV